MRPFTYGAAGWATLAYIKLGHFERARRMLTNHFKPEGLTKNATRYVEDAAGAFSFAHEVRTDGTTNGRRPSPRPHRR